MKKNKRNKKGIFLCIETSMVMGAFLASFLFSGCSLISNYTDEKIDLQFSSSYLEIHAGGKGMLYLASQPMDALDIYDVHFKTGSSTIAQIVRASEREVEFAGLAAGSTVITAEVKKNTCSAVITVIP